MNKQIKKLDSNHQLLVRDTKTGKTYVINKDDANLGGGLSEFPFIEGDAGFPLDTLDIPLFFIDGPNTYLTNFPLTTGVRDIYKEYINKTITNGPVIIDSVAVSNLGTSPVRILANIPPNSALKGYILIKYIPGTTAYDFGGESGPTFRFLDENGNVLQPYTAWTNCLLDTVASHWFISLDDYVDLGLRAQARSNADIESIYIQMWGENDLAGPLNPTLGNGSLEVTTVYEPISLAQNA